MSITKPTALWVVYSTDGPTTTWSRYRRGSFLGATSSGGDVFLSNEGGYQ